MLHLGSQAGCKVAWDLGDSSKLHRVYINQGERQMLFPGLHQDLASAFHRRVYQVFTVMLT